MGRCEDTAMVDAEPRLGWSMILTWMAGVGESEYLGALAVPQTVRPWSFTPGR